MGPRHRAGIIPNFAVPADDGSLLVDLASDRVANRAPESCASAGHELHTAEALVHERRRDPIEFAVTLERESRPFRRIGATRPAAKARRRFASTEDFSDQRITRVT